MTILFSRPETSFNWFTNPWKVFKILIWRRYKWHIIIGLIIILLIIFVVLLAYTAPVGDVTLFQIACFCSFIERFAVSNDDLSDLIL
jgi:hypothetical protein